MNRRVFLSALAAAVAAPAIPGRRIYSFLWDNPLVQAPPFFGVNRDVPPITLNGVKVYAFGSSSLSAALERLGMQGIEAYLDRACPRDLIYFSPEPFEIRKD